MRILVLGGTTEARQLIDQIRKGDDHEVILSLAGRTRAPHSNADQTRIGGFGGVEGLAAYIKDAAVDAVIDASHPFAAQISTNVVAAVADPGLPLCRLERPPWTATPGDRWISVEDLPSAAAALPAGARVFLSVGSLGAEAFRYRRDLWFLIRALSEPSGDWPSTTKFHIGPPVSSIAEEIDLLRSNRIAYLVTRNSGANAGQAKISAAKALDLPVVMISRPILPDCFKVAGVPAVLDWLSGL